MSIKPLNLFLTIFLIILVVLSATFYVVRQTKAATEVVGLIRQDCSGHNNCFTSLAAWEVAYGGIDFGFCSQGDLVCADKIAVAEIDGAWSQPDTTAVSIDGWTTGPNNYIRIYTTSAARHDGKWNTQNYRLENSLSNTIQIEEDYVRIVGLQIYNGISGGSAIYIKEQSSAPTSDVLISHSILKGEGNITKYGIRLDPAGTLKVWNNIIYDFTASYAPSIYILNPDSFAYIYNNTIQNTVYGIKVAGGAITAKNNIVQLSSKNSYYGTFNSNSDYNLSDDTSSTSGANDKTSQTVNFVDETNDDFHLASNDTAAKNRGTSLSEDIDLAFSDDIDGQTRPGDSAWDIGADEISVYQCSDKIDNDSDGLMDYPNDPGCASTTDNDERNASLDTAPPLSSDAFPTGTLPAGTSSTTLSLITNENATCRYSSTSNVSYATMPNTFSITGGASHSTTISGLTNGTTYNYYVRCQDTADNSNTNDYTITFSVALPHPDGSLLRAASDIKVQLIINNQRLWIPTSQAFNSLGLAWSVISETSQAQIEQYPRLTLARASSSPKIYYLNESGLKRHIPNPEVFISYGNKWEEVVTLEQQYLDIYPDSNLIRLEGGTKVYLLKDGQKHWIKTQEVFNQRGYDWTKIAPVNQVELEAYEEGKQIPE